MTDARDKFVFQAIQVLQVLVSAGQLHSARQHPPLQVFGVMLTGIKQAGIFHRHGHGIGNGRQQFQFGSAKRIRPVSLHRDDADNPFAHEHGHTHHRLSGQLRAPNLDRRQLALFLLEVTDEQRLAANDDAIGEAGLKRSPLGRFAHIPIDPNAKVQFVRRLVIQGHKECLGGHDACDFPVDDFQQIGQVEGGANGARDTIEQRQPLGTLQSLVQQAHLINGDGGMIGQQRGQPHLILGVPAGALIVGDVDDANNAPAHFQRHAQYPPERRIVVHIRPTGPALIILDHQGLAGLRDLTRQTFAPLEPGAQILRRQVMPNHQFQRFAVGLHQVQAAHPRAQQLGRAPDNGLQQGMQINLRIDVQRGLVQSAHLARALRQHLFGALALADVPEHALHADDAAIGRVLRRLQRMHPRDLAVDDLITFIGFKGLAAFNDAAIVGPIFRGQLVGMQIKIGLADDVGQLLILGAAVALVGVGKTARLVFAEDVDGQRLHQRVIQRFRIDERVLGQPPLGNINRHAQHRRAGRVGQRKRNLGRLQVAQLALHIGDMFVQHQPGQLTVDNLQVRLTETHGFVRRSRKVRIGLADEVLDRCAIDFGRRLIDQHKAPVSIFGINQIGHQIDDLSQAHLAGPHRLLGLFARGDIAQHQQPAGGTPAPVQQRRALDVQITR